MGEKQVWADLGLAQRGRKMASDRVKLMEVKDPRSALRAFKKKHSRDSGSGIAQTVRKVHGLSLQEG